VRDKLRDILALFGEWSRGTYLPMLDLRLGGGRSKQIITLVLGPERLGSLALVSV
jgi:hypothetical protein